MRNPYALNKILIKHNPLLTTISSGEYRDDIIPESVECYRQLVGIAQAISNLSLKPAEDLEYLLKGMVLAKPYKQKDFIEQISKITGHQFSDVAAHINAFLENAFEKESPDLQLKLKTFRFDLTSANYRTINSRNPAEIKLYVDRTNACISDSPEQFYSQIVADAATVYLLTRSIAHHDLKQVPKSEADVSYARLYLFQNEARTMKFFAVDNVWFNKNNRALVNHVIEQIQMISQYFDIPFFDHAITKEYLQKHPEKTEIYVNKQRFYKVGRVPLIERYFHLRTNFENGVFCITPGSMPK